MVHCCLLQGLAGHLRRLPPARHDDVGVDLLGDEQLGFLQDMGDVRSSSHTESQHPTEISAKMENSFHSD